ncbi:MAG: hypothetical protein U0795_18640 [Pirellulales bacterium]
MSQLLSWLGRQVHARQTPYNPGTIFPWCNRRAMVDVLLVARQLLNTRWIDPLPSLLDGRPIPGRRESVCMTEEIVLKNQGDVCER